MAGLNLLAAIVIYWCQRRLSRPDDDKCVIMRGWLSVARNPTVIFLEKWFSTVIKKLIKFAHGKLVFGRRKSTLAHALSAFLNENDNIIDVGAGDGSIARLIKEILGDVEVIGIDVLLRPETAIEIRKFDGKQLPFEDNTCDAVTFVDVLHHTDNPEELLAEARRVCCHCVVIKDHLAETSFDRAVLRFMDWVGNAPHSVVLPYNYASRQTWDARFREAGLNVARFTTDVPLYPWPFSLLFGRSLHFIAKLTPVDQISSSAQQQN
jgi:SAM-dependent methyltransferase